MSKIKLNQRELDLAITYLNAGNKLNAIGVVRQSTDATLIDTMEYIVELETQISPLDRIEIAKGAIPPRLPAIPFFKPTYWSSNLGDAESIEIIKATVEEIQELINQELDKVDNNPDPQSGLAQFVARYDKEYVFDFLDNGEGGIGFEHLIYMVTESGIMIPAKTKERLIKVALSWGYTEEAFNILNIDTFD